MTDIAELYRTHRGHMFRLACRYVRDAETAEDVVQEVFERLLNVEGIRDPEAATSYLRTATVHRSVSAIRRRAVRQAGDDQVGRRELKRDEPSAEQVALQKLLVDAVPDALRALAPRQRTVLALRYWDDMNEEQISAALGISRGAIKSHTARGKANLASILDGVRQPYA